MIDVRSTGAGTMPSIRIGQLQIDTVVESENRTLPLSELLPQASAEGAKAATDWLGPRYLQIGKEGEWRAVLSFQSYVVRTRRHVVLIDTCAGNDKDRGGHPWFHRLATPWLARLADLGLAPGDIDVVLCTHLHADHVGWNTRLENGRWVPTFPKARYLFCRREYEHRESLWRQGKDQDVRAFADSVLPVIESGQGTLVEADHVLDSQLCLQAAPGHTPGNIIVQLGDSGQDAMLSGDVIHHPLQVTHPEWSSAFCEDPVAAAHYRRRFVDTHGEKQTLIVPAHFPAPTAGFIRRHGDRHRFQFL
ncbi:MAG: MBL fold metallo-hydrolase [Steroidobacteraceae bacterium]